MKGRDRDVGNLDRIMEKKCYKGRGREWRKDREEKNYLDDITIRE